MSVTVTPLKPEIGVEIVGLHGHAFVDRSVAAQCQDLLDQHGVVVYREANIGDDDLVAFSRLLGTVHERPKSEDSGYPEIFIVSLDPGLSTAAAVQPGTFAWHIDGTTSEFPQKATLLTCWEASNDGSGDTEFANTYAAYAALSDADKAELDGLLVEYGYATRNVTPRDPGTLRRGPRGLREHAAEGAAARCGRAGTAASPCCSVQRPVRSSAGRPRRAASCSSGCSSGRRSLASC